MDPKFMLLSLLVLVAAGDAASRPGRWYGGPTYLNGNIYGGQNSHPVQSGLQPVLPKPGTLTTYQGELFPIYYRHTGGKRIGPG